MGWANAQHDDDAHLRAEALRARLAALEGLLLRVDKKLDNLGTLAQRRAQWSSSLNLPADAAVKGDLSSEDLNLLESAAFRTLEGNTVVHPDGPFITAGRHQYRSMWTRDFAYTVRGLLLKRADSRSDEGEHALVRRQIETVVRLRRRKDHLCPKGLDTMPLERRVVRSTCVRICRIEWIFKCLGRSRAGWALPFGEGELVPLYNDHLGSCAIDSNILILQAALDHDADPHVGAEERILVDRAPDFVDVLSYPMKRFDFEANLLPQPAYSDWQDSVVRVGFAFLTNLQLWNVLSSLKALVRDEVAMSMDGEADVASIIDKALPDDAVVEALRENLKCRFLDVESGLFISVLGHKQISLDGNLLALESKGFLTVAERDALFENLKRHPLWTMRGVPGIVTVPNYPTGSKASQVRFARLHLYHDQGFWPHLAAWAAAICYRLGDVDEGERIAKTLALLVRRDESVLEIYDKVLRPVKTWAFSTERGFSWSAGRIVEMLDARRCALDAANNGRPSLLAAT